MSKVWVLPEPISLEEKEQHPDIHPVVLQLLHNREVHGAEGIHQFLHPDYEKDIHGPEEFSQMEQAVERIFKALGSGEHIRIHGDYDADGICGTSILYTTLRDLVRRWSGDGAPSEDQISGFLPDREKDGYGFAVPTIERFAEEGVNLVITVDCGISNKPTVDRGCELGIDTIICDHHTMPEHLPEAATLIHPLVPGETYPNKHLCGTGVASKLCWGLLEGARQRGFDIPEGYEKWLLDFVAIATVTDVMPLVGENRTLQTYGLKVLNKTRRPGLKKLIEISGANKTPIETWNIGFQIGPRINAAGRITQAREAFDLLIEEDDIAAAILAANLDQVNRDRQKASDALYKEAKQLVSDEHKLIVVYGEDWHLGLVGLVAGKLLSEFGRPVFVVAKHGDRFTGSGRSIQGFDVTKPLHAASEHLHKFGGHPQACGFTAMGEENFQAAMNIAQQMAEDQLTEEVMQPRLFPDVEIRLDDIDEAFVEQVESLAPFGEKNPQPLFVSRQVQVVRMSSVGKDGKHLKMTVCDKGGDKTWDVIGFGYGDLLEELSIGDIIEIAYELSFNVWNGYRNVQLRLVDIKMARSASEAKQSS